MTERPDSEAHLDSADRELGERLEDHRPVPSAGFRGALARQLAARDPGYGPRPEHLGLMIGASSGGGVLLIALAALTAVGAP